MVKMQKTLLSITLLILLTTLQSCNEQTPKEHFDLDYGQGNLDIIDNTYMNVFYKIDNLKGNVKTIKYNEYDVIDKFGEVIKGDMIPDATANCFIEFNKENQIKRITYYQNDLVYSKEICIYNNKKLIEYKKFFTKKRNPEKLFLTTQNTYKYNKKGHLILAKKNTYINNDTLTSEDFYNYEYTNSKLTNVEFKKESVGYPKMKRVNKFNNKKQLIEYSFIEENENLTSTVTQSFDENDMINEKLFFYKNKLISKETFEYNSNNKKTESNLYKSNKLKEKHAYSYNSSGNLIEVRNYDYDSRHKGLSVYKYNNNGDELEVIYFDVDGKYNSSSKTIYTYDEKNNWIKMILYSEKEPVKIIERKITYYNN